MYLEYIFNVVASTVLEEAIEYLKSKQIEDHMSPSAVIYEIDPFISEPLVNLDLSGYHFLNFGDDRDWGDQHLLFILRLAAHRNCVISSFICLLYPLKFLL